ncbi:MAG: GAF domain-containing protein [Chloroflexi bacterium]|nr:GAF domain-containing protein [Chloroflexota bacterium]
MDSIRLPKFLNPPRFANETTSRQAAILNVCLWVGLFLVVVYTFITLLLPPSRYLNITVELSLIALHLISLALMHRGYPWLAASLYTACLWLLIASVTLSFGDITGTGATSLYTVILIGGILLGIAGAFSLAALSMTVVAATTFFSQNTPPTIDDWIPALTVAINFGLVAVAAWLGQRNIIKSLTSAESSQTLLSNRSAQLQAAAEIGTATATSKDLSSLLQTITQVIAERFGFYHVAILTPDLNAEEPGYIVISEGGRKAGKRTLVSAKPSDGRSIIAHAARTKKPYLARDVKTDALYLHNPQFDETRSEIAVPIIAGGSLLGVLDVLSNQENPLTTDEMNALQVLANQIGSAVHSHGLLEDTQRHLEELIALNAIATAGTEALSEDEFITRATEVVGKSLFPTNFGVLLLDEKKGLLQHHASYTEKRAKVSPPIPLGEGITGLVALSGQAARVADVSSEPKYISVDPRVRSELCVPLKIGERVLGVLDAESYEVDSFSKTDEHLLQTLAGQISTSLERIRLLSEAQQRADELANTLKQQKELARLRDEFIQNVSHEFRTPLSIVNGYIEILDSGEFGPLPEPYKQPVDIIAKRVRSLTKLVEDLTSLLDMAAHRGDFTILRLSDVINPMYADFRTRALAERIELNLDIGSSLPSVHGEETLLRKAVENLVDNAIKFTPPEGKVDIRLKSENSSVMVEVSDSGLSIPAEEQQRIFDRFYQIEAGSTRRYGGTGLGLALVKEIVELHGGEIHVRSNVGEGSTFQIKLPAIK